MQLAKQVEEHITDHAICVQPVVSCLGNERLLNSYEREANDSQQRQRVIEDDKNIKKDHYQITVTTTTELHNYPFHSRGENHIFCKTVTIDSIEIYYLWATIHHTNSHKGSLILN